MLTETFAAEPSSHAKLSPRRSCSEMCEMSKRQELRRGSWVKKADASGSDWLINARSRVIPVRDARTASTRWSEVSVAAAALSDKNMFV